MQAEADIPRTVERIANNRSCQTLGMSRMQPQLMGATRQWSELDKSPPSSSLKHPILCHSSLTLFEIDLLAWSMCVIRRQRQLHTPQIALYNTFKQSYITLFDTTGIELALQ